MNVVRSFRELETYKMARTGAQEIFQLTKGFPKDERFSMTDQMRRSSRAVKALLAEAWARRRYRAAFVNKVDEAMGEAMETQSWLDDALDCGYIAEEQHCQLDNRRQMVGGMLSKMIIRADDFCKRPPDYGDGAEG